MSLIPAENNQIMTVAEIKGRVQILQQVLSAVMKKDVDYGTIPGTPKPTLYKPGSEKILSTFRIAIEPVVEDLSTYDVARFRVSARAIDQLSGIFLGAGVGECSSLEEKYKWRKANSDREFEATPEDRRRIKYGKQYDVKQVRTEAADLANTILKMAKKRAQIDATLTVTGASDIFEQDLEDVPDEVREEMMGDRPPAKPAPAAPQRASDSGDQDPAKITDGQRKRMYAIYKQAGKTDDEVKAYLIEKYGIEQSKDILKASYDDIIAWCEGKI